MNCDYIIKGRYILPVIDNKWIENNIWPAERRHVNAKFIKRSGELAVLEMLKSGITCFNDMYFFEEVLGGVAERAGQRAILGEVILDFPAPSAKNPQEAIQKTLDQIEEFKKSELIDVAFAPHSIYACSRENLEKINELALANNTLVHIHISETEKELSDALEKYEKTPIEYLNDLNLLSERTVAIHSVWLKKGDFDILKEKNVKISHNPISNMKLASGISPIIEMTREHGITVGLGTDGAASNNTLDLFSEMKMCSMLHKITGLNPEILNAYEIVKMATIDAARVLGKENHLGSLEAGKKADIITINLDKPHLTPIYNPFSHLVYCVEAQDVENVMVNGKMVMCKREVANMDEEMIIKEGELFRIKN